MTREQEKVLAQLRELAERLNEADADRATLLARREVLIAKASALSIRRSNIADAAGVSGGRVSQVRGDAPDEPFGMPHVPAGPLVSEVVTRRTRRVYSSRVTAWASLAGDTGARVVAPDGTVSPLAETSLAAVLGVIGHAVTRVFVTGDWTGIEQRAGETRRDAVRRWGSQAPEGWSLAGHWTDTDTPTFRWIRPEGTLVEITTCAAWFGDAPAEVCRLAWHELAQWVAVTFPGGTLLTTPATTGRDLWQRSLGERAAHPVLSEGVRALIRQTSGQGRIELRPEPASVPDGGFTYLDGRVMYAALLFGMPVGEPVHVMGADADHAMLNKRGRWRARVSVPAGWDHVGLLGRRSLRGWEYPSVPGESWETWADAEELRLAVRHGWGVELVEGIVWPREGRPLTAWRDAILDYRQALPDGAVGDALRDATRALILFTIGGFAAGPATREGIASDESDVPAGSVVFTMSDGRLRFIETTPATQWQAEMAHPEWAATVWARARVRLLEHNLPDGRLGGALTLPPESIIGFRTDALYVMGPAPEWADDGKPGRFRVKGRLAAAAWPSDSAGMVSMRQAAEREYEGESK